MQSPLSQSSVLEFIKLDGLQKLTSVTAHDWDLYIFKELVDNALDADESSQQTLGVPRVEVEMKYDSDSEGHDHWFDIVVRNRAPFPLENLGAIFDLHQRVSTKGLFSLPSRGAQGNALKTILGIPYALHDHYFASYDLTGRLKPIYVRSGNESADIRLHINERQQTVDLELPPPTKFRPIKGTEIYVGLERFIQKQPRRPEELMRMAQSFALFNPHAQFDFSFILDGHEYSFRSLSNPNWDSKYDLKQYPPPTWYAPNQFRRLLHALLYRADDTGTPIPTLYEVAKLFGFSDFPTSQFEAAQSLETLVDKNRSGDLNPFAVQQLHKDFIAHTAGEPPLGWVGSEAFRHALPDADPALFFYQQHVTAGTKENAPFVLEVVLYRSTQEGARRQIIYGINHAPTYRDPFFNKPLLPPDQPIDQPQRSLDKLLDFYQFRDTDPITMIIHLISPAIIYENYGKSAITDELFREPLVTLIDKVVAGYREATREPEPIDYLSEPAREALPSVATQLTAIQIPFSENQLLSALKRYLRQTGTPQMIEALTNTDANSRLTSVLSEYLREHPISYLTKQTAGRLAMPRYPREVAYIPFGEQHLIKLLHEYGVRAILIAGRRELEDLLLLRRFPTRYDVALLPTAADFKNTIELLARTLKYTLTEATKNTRLAVPIWVVHDATLDGLQRVDTIRAVFQTQNLPTEWIIDLGLSPQDPELAEAWLETLSQETLPNISELKLSPSEMHFYIQERKSALLDTLPPETFTTWFEKRLTALGIPLKSVPDLDSLANLASERIRERLGNVVANIALNHLNIEQIETEIQARWGNDLPRWKEKLHAEMTAIMAEDKYREGNWLDILETEIDKLVYQFMSDEVKKAIHLQVEALS